jgi:diacylglycerol kinase family enzyme
VLTLVLVALSNLCARFAFGYERALVKAEKVGHRVRPARHPVLIMNTQSGGEKVTRFNLVEEARRRGIQPVVLAEGDDLRALAENAVAQGADVIGVAGGDGSQALVADVARSHNLPFVCVPAGTRNHFALDLGLDRNNITAALDAFGDAVERRIDLATVGGRVFVNNASLGLYATIVSSDQYRDAKLATTASLLPDLVGAGTPELDLRFTGPDGILRQTADLVLVSNNPYLTRPLTGAGTRPRLDTGQLGVLVIRTSRLGGDADDPGRLLPDVEEWAATAFRVDSAELVRIGLDGEALELPPPLDFRILPGALRIRLPRSAPGAAHTVVYGIRGTVRALLQILTTGT